MSLELLLFEIAGSLFGISTAPVRGVVRAAALFPLPEFPEAIEGGLNLRGDIVPVIDGRALFAEAHQPIHPHEHFIVLEADQKVAAIHVDRALEVVVADPFGTDAEQASGQFVQCVLNTARGATSVLDVAALVGIAHASEIPATPKTRSEA